MMSLRCRSCNTAFHDNGSLEVHYQYAHSNGNSSSSLPAQDPAAATRPTVEPDGESAAATSAESNNNHFYKFQNNSSGSLPADGNSSNDSVMTAISPGNGTGAVENRGFHVAAPVAPHHRGADLVYDVPPAHHGYDAFMMNAAAAAAQQEYHARSSPVVGSQNSGGGGGYPFTEQRYHPYYKQGFREVPRQLQRCDKCEFQCHYPDQLLHHYTVAHNTLAMHAFNPRGAFGNHQPPPVNGGAEPQAEILDLDSHKVHVYQPPSGEDSQDSDQRSMDPWAHEEKKYYHQQLQINQNGATNGRGGTPLPSPDFGSVSTTTDNIENLQSSTRSPYYEPNAGPGGGGGAANVNTTPAQISSSDNPTGRSSSKAGKNSNGTWKSNEARRPKTYNCSACNKWFTSSGHLKRHYNTTLHKNAVKQSGAPDPATLPVSAHHHPQKDPTYPSSRQAKNSPPNVEPEPAPVASVKLEPSSGFAGARNSQPIPQAAANAFLHGSPNLIAGPSEVPGGLLHPSYTQSPPDLIKSPSPITSLPPHSNHSNYHLAFGPPPNTQQPHTVPPFFQQHTPTTLYPNFKSPHVYSTHRATRTTTHTGNLADVLDDCSDSKLPSFACIQKAAAWNSGLDQFLSTLDTAESNVGGSFTSKEVESTTEYLLKQLQHESKPPYVKSEPIAYKEEQQPREEYAAAAAVAVKTEPVYVKCEPTTYADPESTTEVLHASPQPVEDTNVTSSTERTSPLTASAVASGNFCCEKCHKFFNKACYLTQHNKSFHSGLKPFKCSRCGKRFQDLTQYTVHLAKHSGDKPYKCELCPKAFNHKTDLRRHVCLHTSVRPYSCDICAKGFIRKDHMLKHRDTHQNRKSVQRRFRVEKLKKELELEIAC